MTETDYGNWSTLLAEHQGLVRKGSLVRVLSPDGTWQEYQVHAKGKGCWVNVSSVGATKPTFSTQLLPGGRWYRIDYSGERIVSLERGGAVDPVSPTHHPINPDPAPGPTIMNRGSLEAGGTLATPADRDNTDSFSQLIEAHPSYEDSRFLTKMIQDLIKSHPDLIGLDKIENGMRLLVTALTELRGIGPNDPDARMKVSQAELKEGQLIQYLKEQMTYVHHYTVNDDNQLLVLERDFMTFMESYRVRKIQIIQVLNQLQPTAVEEGLLTNQTIRARTEQDHEGENIYDEPAPTGVEKKFIWPDLDTQRSGSCMDIESLDDGYMQATSKKDTPGTHGAQVSTMSPRRQSELEDWDQKPHTAPHGASPAYSENGRSRRDQLAISGGHDRPDTFQRETGARKRESLREALGAEFANIPEIKSQLNAGKIDEEKPPYRGWALNRADQVTFESDDPAGKEGSNEDANKRSPHLMEHESTKTGLATSKTHDDHLRVLEERQQQHRVHWDTETRKIIDELQQLRHENERLRKAETAALARLPMFEGLTDEQSFRSSKPLQTRMQERSREILKQELRNEFSNLLETRLHSHKANLGNVPRDSETNVQMGGREKTGENPNLGSTREAEDQSQMDALVRLFETKFGLIQERLSTIEKQGSTKVTTHMAPGNSDVDRPTLVYPQATSTPTCIRDPITSGQGQPDGPNFPGAPKGPHPSTTAQGLSSRVPLGTLYENPQPQFRQAQISENTGQNMGVGPLIPDAHVDLLDEEIPDYPSENEYFPAESMLQGHLEELEELSLNVEKFNKITKRVIQEGHDGKVKSHRSLASTKFERLSELSRRSRNQFKKEARLRFGPSRADSIISNPSINRNLALIAELEGLMEKLDEKIESRGLDLIQTGSAPDVKIVWPTFTGSDLPLVHTFLTEIQKLMVDGGIPVSQRGTILAQSVKAEAKTILSNCDLDRNPSFEIQAAVLKDHFGQVGSQMSLLTRLHQSHGKIPMIGDESQPVFRIYNLVKGHLKLLRAAKDLQEKYDQGELSESPISSGYLNTIESFLPRDSVNKLTDIEGYTSTLPTQSRFQLLITAFKSLQTWASSMISKHGINESGGEPKKRARAQNPMTLVAAPTGEKGTGNSQIGKSASPTAPPQFTGSPPVPAIPLYVPQPPIPTSTCYYCKKPGHWASNCPSKRSSGAASQAFYNGQAINLVPYGNGQRFSKADMICFVCQTLPNTSALSPSPHIFTRNGRLERFLCPRLTSLSSMEERASTLERSGICMACLNGLTTDHRHNGQTCGSLESPSMQVLKCYHVGCRKRWTLCVTHKQENAQNITNYKKSTEEHLQMSLSLITTLSPDECIDDDVIKYDTSVNLNASLGALPSRIYSNIQKLINASKTPILHVNENNYTFMIYLMQGKSTDAPVLVCFDTGSAFTLVREDALKNKIQGPSVKLPGSSSVVGIGGKQSADSYYCSIPLDNDESGGFSSKIMSCLSVQQIVDIDTLDTTKLVRYLKREYRDQLPADFDLFNFRTLGTRVKLDALIGVQELNAWPRLILKTPGGLGIYKVPIAPAPGTPQYCIAGSLPDLSDVDFPEDQDTIALINEAPPDSLDVGALKEAWDANLQDPYFVDILDDYSRTDLLEKLYYEMDHEAEMNVHPSMMTKPSVSTGSPGAKEAKDEARKIRPRFIVSSPLPTSFAGSVQHIQKQMIEAHPTLLQFQVPLDSLHITHLVLGDLEDIREFATKLTPTIHQIATSRDLSIQPGKITTLNGNICAMLQCPDVKKLQEVLQHGCLEKSIYFDPQQSYHITLFKRDYKHGLQPNVSLAEVQQFKLNAARVRLDHLDFCTMKRTDKNKYFDVEARVDLPDLSTPTGSITAPENHKGNNEDVPQPINTANALREDIVGLCSSHRALINMSLPLIDDWRSLESVESLVNDLYQPFNSKTHKSTIPEQLLQLENRSELCDTLDTDPGVCLSISSPKEDQVKGLLDESVSQFRCLSCKLCNSCNRSNRTGGPTMTLRSEVENLLLKNSVSIDLRTNRIVAKHVLPNNFKDLLGDNRAECERRLRTQLHKLAKRPDEERAQVRQCIKKLIDRGFVCTREEFTEEEKAAVEKNEGPYTLPVSIVFKQSSLSTPSRVCLDGSAKTNTGYSLNCLLPKGALSLSIGSLVQVWKCFPVVASGDLANFYCRFSLDASHWGLQKFLWIDDLDPNGTPLTYFVRTIIFGIRSSGMVCHFGLSKLIEVYDCLKASVFYVDDCISFFYDLEHAKKEVLEIADVLKRYNLPFKSGGLSLVGETPSSEVVNEDGEISISSARWNPVTDHFRCNIPILFIGRTDRGSLAKVQICSGTTTEEIFKWLPDSFTLKDLLSKVASHFDSSMGILTGLIAPMRHLVRKVMIESRLGSTQTNWDHILSEKDRKTFAYQLAEAKKVGSFKYPRFPSGDSPIVPNYQGTLVCFSDAGDFESVVIYLALPQANGKWRFNLVTARSYLVQSGMTIAKSELQAAAHGANATQSVLDNFAGRLSLEPILLLDSQCSMHWIANVDSLLHTFHRNRVLAVASVFGKNIFYVRSKWNIADDISRETVTAQSVSPDSRFYKGPTFLEDGVESAQNAGLLLPLSDISQTNMTPELLEVFRSGIILSKFQDLNFMTLKNRVKGSQTMENISEEREDENGSSSEQACTMGPSPVNSQGDCSSVSPTCGLVDNLPTQEQPTMSSLRSPASIRHSYLRETNRLITCRNNMTSVSHNHDLLASDPREHLPLPETITQSTSLFCTSCCIEVPGSSALTFYSTCNMKTRHHAFGSLTLLDSPAPSLASTCDRANLASCQQGQSASLTLRSVNQLITTRNMSANKNPSKVETNNPDSDQAIAAESPPEDQVVAASGQGITTETSPDHIAGSESAENNPHIGDSWTQRTRDMATKINYLINPVGLSLPQLCRAGATALRFIYLIVDSISHKQPNGPWGQIKTRVFTNPLGVRRICLSVVGNCPGSLDPSNKQEDHPYPEDNSMTAVYHRIHASVGVGAGNDTPLFPTLRPLHPETLLHRPSGSLEPPTQAYPILHSMSRHLQEKGWLRYPGIFWVRGVIGQWKTLFDQKYQRARSREYQSTTDKLEELRILISSLCQSYCRPSVQYLGTMLALDLTNIVRANSNHPGFRRCYSTDSLRSFNSAGRTKFEPQLDTYLPKTNFVQAMQGSYATSCYFISLLFLHLVRQEQKYLHTRWPGKRRERYCLSRNGVWVFNTRMTTTVRQKPSPISADPDSTDFSQLIPSLDCPVLDKSSPLYISVARHVHYQLDLPIQPSAGLFQKHRGASQNHMLCLRFCFAPGGISVFKRIQECCFICRVRTRKYVRTSEGDLHHAQLAFVKPFQSAHVDLMGPLIMKSHHSVSTRKISNERKVWLLVLVCSITRAVWTEIMHGVSTSDFSDALTRAMTIIGSITHMVTDRSATQVKVLRDGKFIEQVKYQMYRRFGWHCECIPVSKHKWNGLVEGRIASLREMLSFPENKIPMTTLNFLTHLRLATSLLNSVPFAHSFEGGSASPELKVISPASFLYPLNSLHRPILSPVMLDKVDTGYFGAVKEHYQNLITKFIDAVVPIVAKKYHKYYQTPGDELAQGDIVLFKKRPNATFLPGWCLGRVTKILRSKGRTVRSIQLEYILNKNSHLDQDPYENGMEGMRSRIDRNLSRVDTVRETDEVIKLHPVDPQENDMYKALEEIFAETQTAKLDWRL